MIPTAIMQGDLKLPFVFSLVLHLSIFAVLSYKPKTAVYITVPIEMFFYSAPPPRETAVAAPQEKQKKEEVVIPKKHKAEKIKPKKEKEAEKKEEKPKVEQQSDNAQKSVTPLVPSGQITFDAIRFPYTYYTNMVVKKISRNWQWSVEFGQLKTVVYFRINRDGGVASMSVKNSSGDKLFDQQALRAVELASPFPPLPAAYNEDDLGVYFEFSFKE